MHRPSRLLLLALLAAVSGLGAACATGPHTVPSPVAQGRRPRARVVVEAADGYTAVEREKLANAVVLVERVVDDQEFQAQVLVYGRANDPPGFSQALRAYAPAPATNADVLDALLAGNAPRDGVLRLFLGIEANHREVGHTSLDEDQRGVTRTDYGELDRLELAELVGHLVHEHLHRIGFSHAPHRSRERCDSIPYAIGRIACTVAKARFGSQGSCDVPPDGRC